MLLYAAHAVKSEDQKKKTPDELVLKEETE